jgi:hypothetical protein
LTAIPTQSSAHWLLSMQHRLCLIWNPYQVSAGRLPKSNVIFWMRIIMFHPQITINFSITSQSCICCNHGGSKWVSQISMCYLPDYTLRRFFKYIRIIYIVFLCFDLAGCKNGLHPKLWIFSTFRNSLFLISYLGRKTLFLYL